MSGGDRICEVSFSFLLRRCPSFVVVAVGWVAVMENGRGRRRNNSSVKRTKGGGGEPTKGGKKGFLSQLQAIIIMVVAAAAKNFQTAKTLIAEKDGRKSADYNLGGGKMETLGDGSCHN